MIDLGIFTYFKFHDNNSLIIRNNSFREIVLMNYIELNSNNKLLISQ
jgi:hypothetical protein